MSPTAVPITDFCSSEHVWPRWRTPRDRNSIIHMRRVRGFPESFACAYYNPVKRFSDDELRQEVRSSFLTLNYIITSVTHRAGVTPRWANESSPRPTVSRLPTASSSLNDGRPPPEPTISVVGTTSKPPSPKQSSIAGNHTGHTDMAYPQSATTPDPDTKESVLPTKLESPLLESDGVQVSQASSAPRNYGIASEQPEDGPPGIERWRKSRCDTIQSTIRPGSPRYEIGIEHFNQKAREGKYGGGLRTSPGALKRKAQREVLKRLTDAPPSTPAPPLSTPASQSPASSRGTVRGDTLNFDYE